MTVQTDETKKLDGLPLPRRYWAIVAISMGTALAVLDGAVVGVALPTLAHDLGVRPSEAVLVVTVYQLVLVMALLPFSALGTRVGLRRLYQYGQITFTLATLLCFFANSLPFLIVVRVLQALGGAAALSVASAMIREIYPSDRLGHGLGINSIVVHSANTVAPLLSGAILAVASWRYIFVATLPFACLSLMLGRHSLPDPAPRDEPYDVLAAVMCAAMFGLSIVGIETLVHGDSPVISLAIIAAGVGLGVVFVRRELRSAEPILPVDLLTRPVIALSVAGAQLSFIGSTALMLWLPFRLQQAGFPPEQIGALMAPWPMTMMLVAPLAGFLSDRIPAGLLGGIGMTLAATAALSIALLPPHFEHWQLVWRMVMAGAAYGLFLAPNARLIITSTPRHRAASAGGLIATNRLTAQTLGATLLAALFALNLDDSRVPALIVCGLSVLALLCSMARLRVAPADSD